MKRMLSRSVVSAVCVTAIVGAGMVWAQNTQSDQRDDQDRSQQRFSEQDRADYSQDSQRFRRDQDTSTPRDYTIQQRGQTGQQDQYRSSRSDEQAGLGVTLAEGREGVRITSVVPGSPAERAGLRQGDEILAINGSDARSMRDVIQRIQQQDSGSRVRLTVLRQGNQRTLDVQLATRQEALSRADRDAQMRRQQDGQYQSRFDDRYSDQRDDTQRRLYGDSQTRFEQQILQQLENLQRQMAQLQREIQQLRSSQRYDAQRAGYQSPAYDGRYSDDRQTQSQRFDRQDRPAQQRSYDSYDEETNRRSQTQDRFYEEDDRERYRYDEDYR